MNSRTRSRRPASIGSNQSSRTWITVPASDCRAKDFVLLLVMAWSPPDARTSGSFEFQHPETTPPSIPTTPRTSPNDEKLHAFQPVGASVARYLARDQNGQKDDQNEAGGESQIHRGRTDKVAREYQDRGHEERHLDARSDRDRER